MGRTRQLLIAAMLGLCSPVAVAQVVYQQPHVGNGNVLLSSWVPPNGTDADWYVYDNFTLPSSASITEVRWRGGYKYGAPYGQVFDFSIMFYASAAANTQPYCNNPGENDNIYLARHVVGHNAGETPAGVFGGTAMYDYAFALPTPFQAAANTKYWIKIEGSQPSLPDWGVAVGGGGNGQHFRFSTGMAVFQFAPGDASFTLLGSACYPDCNADATLTIADFGCFQAKFVAGDPYADCNASGGLTIADFGCFQTSFVSGCP